MKLLISPPSSLIGLLLLTANITAWLLASWVIVGLISATVNSTALFTIGTAGLLAAYYALCRRKVLRDYGDLFITP